MKVKKKINNNNNNSGLCRPGGSQCKNQRKQIET